MAWIDITETVTASVGAVVTETVAVSQEVQLEASVTLTPPATIVATSSAIPQAEAANPPAGLFIPGGIVGDRWKGDPAIQLALGFAATEQAQGVAAAYQSFEHGAMIWRGDTQEILAVYHDNTWESFDDTFKEGEIERDPNLYTPGELLQPERGFGKLWRSDPDLQKRIGWGTSPEKGETALIQKFEHGLVIWAGGRGIFLIDGAEGRTWN
jgi:hypothetical protein